ncbi:hypothetical protein [Bacillus cereus group sp. Sample61]|uniref:hypothetical protein n=1 Tax=Bacillus cereus group sp. Sample61 TaxID=2816448 RepID=UPI002FDC26AA
MDSYEQWLINQNNDPTMSDGQREANNNLLRLYKAVTREKQLHETYKGLDVITERLEDNSYRCTPNKLLSTD